MIFTTEISLYPFPKGLFLLNSPHYNIYIFILDIDWHSLFLWKVPLNRKWGGSKKKVWAEGYLMKPFPFIEMSLYLWCTSLHIPKTKSAVLDAEILVISFHVLLLSISVYQKIIILLWLQFGGQNFGKLENCCLFLPSVNGVGWSADQSQS